MILAHNEHIDYGMKILILLHSSTFDDEQREDIIRRFYSADESEAEDIIENVLLNQVDPFINGSYRLKDINRQLDRK